MNQVKDIRRVRTEQEKADALFVRRRVFIEEQNVPESLEVDEYDRPEAPTIHFVAYRDGKPVGAGRLRVYDRQTGKVERVAVLDSERGTGLGRELMLAMEQTARDEGFSQLKLNAQCHAQPFYEKLGYKPIGDVFDEAGIDHIAMVKSLRD
ncbi:MAG: GNAT family N-acetyltransferase [Brevibacillus sp.]|nr:GNAT family N-acetyltransferase [Brevibacillus sp.]